MQEIIECDLAAEVEARSLYLEAAKYCDSINDRVSKQLFELSPPTRKAISTSSKPSSS